MKIRMAILCLLTGLFLAACAPETEKGDPNVGAAPGEPAANQANQQARPGTAGGPALGGPGGPARDPYGGRSGAAAGQ